MKAVIMAGGEGTRLRPLTCGMPKPLARIGNKPVLSYILELLAKNGISDCAATLMYLPEQIKSYCREHTPAGVNLVFFEEKEPLGTAGSVKNCESFLDGDFLVISGDAMCDFDLNAAIAYHRQRGADATLLLYRVKEPLEYGVTLTDEQGRITQFVEKPSWDRVYADTVNTGIYILNRCVLDMIDAVPCDFGKDLFPRMLREGMKLYGFVCSGYWCDIGSVSSYLDCNFQLLDRHIDVDLPPETPEIVGAKVIPPVIVGKGLTVEAGAVIGPYAVIGDGCRIGARSSIRHSVLGDNVSVGSGVTSRGAIVGDNTELQDGASLEQGVVVGAGCRIGKNSSLKEGVKMWPGKSTAEMTAVGGSQVFGTSALGLFDDEGITGDITEDVNPVFAARLGAAFAQQYHDKIAVAGNCPAADMLADSFSAAARSMGANVAAIAGCPVNVLRFVTAQSGFACGVHFAVSGNSAVIRVYESDGFPPGDVAEKRLQNNFLREDFHPADAAHIGAALPVRDARQQYAAALDNLCGLLPGFRVSVAADDPLQRGLLLDFLLSRGAQEAPGALDIRLGCDGENFSIRENGRDYSYETLLLLLAADAARSGISPVYLPAGAPDLPLGDRNIEVLTGDAGDTPAFRRGYKHMPYTFDNVMAAVRCMDILKRSGKSLRDLTESLPAFSIVTDEVDAEAGRAYVMSLLGLMKDNPIRLGRGLTFITKKGEITITPKRKKEAFTVRAQSQDAETASELWVDFRDKIRKIQTELDKN